MGRADTYIEERACQGGIRHAMLAFEEAAAILDLEPWIVQRLRHPVNESTAYLQIARDSGEEACVPLLAVHHGECYGRSAGSLALAPGLQMRDCQAVGRERAWQSALLRLPFDGASYALVCDPLSWSERELTALARPLSRQLERYRGCQLLFPGRGCHREFLGRLSAELSPSGTVVIGGKPDCMGGLDHALFTSEGIAAAIAEALRHSGRMASDARVAIQGFGELGQALAHRLARGGMKVIAISDNSGAVYRADGLLMSDVSACMAHEPLLVGYTEAEHITRVEAMQADADVLVLTAGANELNASNCEKVTSAIVIEADYGAMEESARETLSGRNKLVMPWMLATCATLLASYFEVQEYQILTREKELLARCYGIVGQAVEDILDYSSEAGCSVEQAAYRRALEISSNYLRSCGWQH